MQHNYNLFPLSPNPSRLKTAPKRYTSGTNRCPHGQRPAAQRLNPARLRPKKRYADPVRHAPKVLLSYLSPPFLTFGGCYIMQIGYDC